MANVAEMLEGRTHGDDFLQLYGIFAHFLQVHDSDLADLDCSVVELGDHELKCPIVESRVIVQDATELVRREQAGRLKHDQVLSRPRRADSPGSWKAAYQTARSQSFGQDDPRMALTVL